ncbi:ABC transporter ATP-binding protein [Bacillus sp. CECT 9360]|uniref:ATP-binding cassette domain-containing protein n=1 Tax=Bacillus sp. CECT 9360 TaxID=2845821 RepID=UPI001E58282F|nr:ABC transporter ATP-binding protein [Bacillus sp. CECT 9360]CAH0344396.1 Bacitracin transport ATP-binding protein BcrA [Bacillus sp. CECT 9360]
MIKLEAVNKELKDKKVLQDISVSFEKGKVYLLKGHNGSGKTMLLRLLCDLIKPTRGTVEKPKYTYGIMIENPSFIEHESARSNLKFLASIQKKIGPQEIELNLNKVNLLDVADKKVKNYSLGMKQRLAFCQAIMEDPDVLLLDEPFNALDDENFAEMIRILQNIKTNKIIVIAAHGFNLSEIPLFDKVITMNDGKIKSVQVV